jgi:hypothetical protein
MTENLKKTGMLVVPAAIVASALLLMAPMLAAAQNPHFVRGPTIEKTLTLASLLALKQLDLET